MSFNYGTSSIKAPSASIKTIDASSIRVIPRGGGDLTDILDLVGGQLTPEQLETLLAIANAEGRNIEINPDGTFSTTIGQTYTVRTENEYILITNANDAPLAEIEPAGQIGFVADTTTCKVSNTDCTVTEVFRGAAHIQLSGGGITISALPDGYLIAEFLESDGAATIALPFEAKNKSFLCEHTLGMPKTTSGLYTYGGTPVSSGYGIRYKAAPQGLSFIGSETIGAGEYKRGGRYKIGWQVQKNENEKQVFSLLHQGSVLSSIEQTYNAYWENVYYVFSSTKYATVIGGATYKLKINIEGQLTCCVIPAIAPNGAPCLYDTVTGKTFFNSGSGSFVAGFTVKQARNLGNLPSSGGSLTISLPSIIVSDDVIADAAVASAVNAAKTKGWNITVQTYTEEATAAASTFGMQRIWVRQREDEHGSYVDAEGNRWQVDWCVTMYTRDDSTPDQHGYELFRSVEAACEYWGLTPYVDPAWEEEINNSQI